MKQREYSDTKRILIVGSDTDALRDIILAAGYTVQTVSDDDSALSAVTTQTYDLLLSDLFLSGGSGIALCRLLRETSTIPIVLLGTDNDETTVTEALDSGADDYLSRPIRRRELLSRINAHIRRAWYDVKSSELNDELIRYGNLQLIPEESKTILAGRTVELTGTEFDLLSFLAKNPGSVFSRSELLRRVWGYEPEFSDVRNVDVYIRRIRKKLGREIIKTKRGAGYYMS